MASFPMDPIQLLASTPSLYFTAFLILASLSLGGLSIGFLWHSCGCQALHSASRWLAEKSGCHGKYSSLWERLNRGVWG